MPRILTVSDLQHFVDSSIRAVGGYWKPLTAVARLLEEVGEVAYQLRNSKRTSSELAEELADVFVISTCIANQYSANLEDEYAVLSVPVSLESLDKKSLKIKGREASGIDRLFQEVIIEASLIARVVSKYDGEKTPKPAEQQPTIAQAVARLHRSLFRLALACDINLVAATLDKLPKAVRRDKERFPTKYDPSIAPCLDRFKSIRDQTQCIFARKAKVWGAPLWNSTATLEDNLVSCLPSLLRFLRIARYEHLDGYVLEVPGTAGGDSISSVANTVRRVLSALVRSDPGERSSCLQDLSSPDWQFTFNNERLFLITFAQCYPETSSRYSFRETGVFFFFQPEHSFEFHLAKLAPDVKLGVKEQIRAAYLSANRPYAEQLARLPLEAQRYVKPGQSGDPIVQWWM